MAVRHCATWWQQWQGRTDIHRNSWYSRPQMKHELRWNPELQEWFCVRCGRTSDHIVCEDAQAEMELFECELPVLEQLEN
jgi:hypothetical protein